MGILAEQEDSEGGTLPQDAGHHKDFEAELAEENSWVRTKPLAEIQAETGEEVVHPAVCDPEEKRTPEQGVPFEADRPDDRAEANSEVDEEGKHHIKVR